MSDPKQELDSKEEIRVVVQSVQSQNKPTDAPASPSSNGLREIANNLSKTTKHDAIEAALEKLYNNANHDSLRRLFGLLNLVFGSIIQDPNNESTRKFHNTVGLKATFDSVPGSIDLLRLIGYQYETRNVKAKPEEKASHRRAPSSAITPAPSSSSSFLSISNDPQNIDSITFTRTTIKRILAKMSGDFDSVSKERDASEYHREESTIRKGNKQAHTIALIGKVTLVELLTSAWNAPPLSLDNFREFADSEDSGENVDFWIDCERLLSIHLHPHPSGSNDTTAVTHPHRSSVVTQHQHQHQHQNPLTHQSSTSSNTAPHGPVMDRWQNWNDLIDDYIRADSTRTVNIPGGMRKKVLTTFDAWKDLPADSDIATHISSQAAFLDALRAAQKEIYNVMNADTFPRFLKKTTVDTRLHLSKEIALWWRQKTLPTCSEFLSFPSPVNLAESRLHNIVNVILITVALALDFWLDFPWLYCYIVYGYIARVLAGPRLDLMAFFVLFLFRPLFVQHIPLLKDEFVAGPPRRLAQLIGLTFAVTATILRFTLEELTWYCFGVWCGLWVASWFAGFLDICFACLLFGAMMRAGCIPEEICAECKVHYMYHHQPSKKSLSRVE